MMGIISFTLYMLGAFLLFFYGIQVCPYIENLDSMERWHLCAIIFIPNVLSWIGFWVLLKRKGGTLMPGKVFQVGLGLWAIVGIVISIINFSFYNIPLGSGAKVMLGSLSLGTLISAILALLREREQIQQSVRQKDFNTANAQRFFSMAKKFSLFSTLCLVQFTFITILLIYKDLSYLNEHVGEAIMASHQKSIFLAIFAEFLFVLGVLLIGSVGVFWLSSQNVAQVYRYIQATLKEVEEGNLSMEIPILSNDEFSRISLAANKMILGLREKERISDIFGKYVSPHIANEILSQKDNSLFQGKIIEAAILFSDIRNFTTLSENHSPKQIVQMLNIYFGHFVKMIHGRGGVLDKFIGDAVMAVFTPNSKNPNPCESAVMTALEMRKNLHSINEELKARDLPSLENGIGIHFGEVISGNIGSPERLEYTVIGDTVNTAARLESATKGVGVSILISKDVFNRLSEVTQSQFKTKGFQTFKGKEKKTEIFCLGGRKKSGAILAPR